MKCRIEKRKVRKGKPSTSCRRIPRQECRKEKCERRKCYERVKMQKDVYPREECGYKERRVCHQTENQNCRIIKRTHCKPSSKPCRQTHSGTDKLGFPHTLTLNSADEQTLNSVDAQASSFEPYTPSYAAQTSKPKPNPIFKPFASTPWTYQVYYEKQNIKNVTRRIQKRRKKVTPCTLYTALLILITMA